MQATNTMRTTIICLLEPSTINISNSGGQEVVYNSRVVASKSKSSEPPLRVLSTLLSGPLSDLGHVTL